MTELGMPVLLPASPRMDRRLIACAASVVFLHAAALAWAQLRPEAPAPAASQARQGRAAVVVRMVPAALPASRHAAAPIGAADATSTDRVAPDQRSAMSAQEGDHAVDLEGYVPRRWLTVAPEPTAPIVLPFPAAFEDRARYSVVLNLYIEADGRVGRVGFEGVPLPDILRHAARSTFENARFTPGQVNGRVVKSLIRVEVDFNSLGSG